MRIAVLLAVIASTTAAACGSQVGAGAASDDPTGPARGVGGDTELTVVVRSGPGDRGTTYVLTCDPPGGDHPAPGASCRELAELEVPFAPVPADQACTEIYGGPQTARVTGTFRGEPVAARFDRTNGCQIDRWDAHAALLAEGGGATGRDQARTSRSSRA